MNILHPVTYWDRIAHLLGGPGHLRFLIQPLLAILLGLRDARHDAALGREPYLFALILRPGRAARFVEGLKTFAKLLTVAVLLDALVQFVTLGDVWVWAALVTGLFLIAFPYSAARGLGNRALRTRQRRHA
jgi:hypothetical protein